MDPSLLIKLNKNLQRVDSLNHKASSLASPAAPAVSKVQVTFRETKGRVKDHHKYLYQRKERKIRANRKSNILVTSSVFAFISLGIF